MTSLGVLKESKPAEYRVALVPTDVRQLIQTGAQVRVETGAGTRAGFPDSEYVSAGASVARSPTDLIGSSDVVIKVKEPVLSEIALLRPGQLYMSFLHLAALPELLAPLARSGATVLGYETIQRDRDHPVLRPMSEIAGTLALQIGEHYLESTSGGRGVLLSGIAGTFPGKVTVVGSGVVGAECGRLAYAIGANVVFFDAESQRLEELEQRFPNARCLLPEPAQIAIELADTDLLIGGVYVTGARAPRVVRRGQIAAMPRGSVAIDVAIDQDGCLETSRPTTHDEPVYVDSGVVHYCVTNIPSMAPRSASVALSAALVPYLRPLLTLGVDDALASEPALAAAVNVRDGRVVLPALGETAVPAG